MKRRREHGECDTREGGRGCLVFGTGVCTFRRKEVGWVEKMKRGWMVLGSMNVLLWWVCAAVMGALLACGWMEMQTSDVQPLTAEE